MDFADFLSPYDTDRFLREIYGQSPLHVSAEGNAGTRKAGLIDRERALALFDNVAQWGEGGVKMVMDSRAVAPEHYSVLREDGGGTRVRPDRALIEAMMALGATLVADGLEDADHRLRTICAMLGRRFAAKASVNLYASQEGVQAFASHCDPHEVFVIQCSGRKRWRVYSGRDDRPTGSTMQQGDQAAIERAKGGVDLDLVLEPGDLLYMPRGVYHDATAVDGPSLHLTFGVQPLYGVAVLDLLRDLALDNATMRDYLPAADSPDIGGQLERLSNVIADLLASPAFLEDLGVRQRTIATPVAPAPPAHTSEFLVRTQLPCRVDQPLSGSVVIFGNHREPAGFLSDAARWIFSQRAFSRSQFLARFCHHPESELEDLIEKCIRHGALGVAER